MDSTEIVLAIISVLGTISSILFAYLAFKRSNKQEHKDEGKNEGVMLSEIGYIKSSIDRIEKSLNHLEERYTDLSNRLVKVEESTKNAHKRITELHDEIKGGANHEQIMNEILLNVLSCVVTAVVIPLITLLGSKLIKWISSKIDNEKTEKYITEATTIVLDAVKCVFQTYVEALKKEGNFGKDAQLIALNKAKDIVLSQLSEDIKNYIKTNFGDVDTWITTQIEASINTLKNKK